MMTNPSIDINSVLQINEDKLLVNWEFKEESYNPLSTVIIVLAAYTTTQVRLKLYEYLERLEDRVIYYDTDSIIYILEFVYHYLKLGITLFRDDPRILPFSMPVCAELRSGFLMGGICIIGLLNFFVTFHSEWSSGIGG